LHKYLYASANPINRIDPSGNDDIGDTLDAMSTLNFMTLLGPGTGSVRAQITQAEGELVQNLAGILVGATLDALSSDNHPEAIKLCFGFDSQRLRDTLIGRFGLISNGLNGYIKYDSGGGSNNHLASIYPDRTPIEITFYSGWYTLPMLPTGPVYGFQKSAAGTIVHELAHYEFAATDVPGGYGEGAINLTPREQFNNADSYSNYAEISYRLLQY
jgi:hypothetical protein